MEGIPNQTESVPARFARERREALETKIFEFEQLLKAPDHFASTRELVAYIEQIEGHAHTLYTEAAEAGEYRLEQAAAKLNALIEAHVQLLRHQVEFATQYPEAYARLQRALPSFDHLQENMHT